MKHAVRIAIAASLVASFAAAAQAATTKGFIRIAGIQGPSKDPNHLGWSELATSDITIDATPGQECHVLAEALLKHVAPLGLARVGDVIPEVEIDLETSSKGPLVTFNALLENVILNRMTTSSENGLQFERLDMSPARIEIETKEIKADGSAGNPRHFQTNCGGGRAP